MIDMEVMAVGIEPNSKYPFVLLRDKKEDIPLLVEGLKRRGFVTLIIDTELHQGLSGQLKTRVEAFVEMMR